jgi:hypothetical protein
MHGPPRLTLLSPAVVCTGMQHEIHLQNRGNDPGHRSGHAGHSRQVDPGPTRQGARCGRSLGQDPPPPGTGRRPGVKPGNPPGLQNPPIGGFFYGRAPGSPVRATWCRDPGRQARAARHGPRYQVRDPRAKVRWPRYQVHQARAALPGPGLDGRQARGTGRAPGTRAAGREGGRAIFGPGRCCCDLRQIGRAHV